MSLRGRPPRANSEERECPRSGSAVGAALRCVVAAVGASFALTLTTPADAQAQWVVGAQGGLSAFSVAGDAPEDASYGRQIRGMASAVLGYRFGSSVVLRIEPGLMQKGASVSYDVDGIEDPVDSLSVNLDYLSVPIVAQVFTPGGRGFVTTGLDLGFLSTATVSAVEGDAEEDVKDRLESTDVSWIFGVGGLVFRGSPEVSLELRYSQSLIKVLEGDPDGSASALPSGLRSSGFQLIAGVAWRLGGNR